MTSIRQIPIEELVAEVAEVRLARLSETGLDAVLYGLHSDERPTLLINEDAPPTRQRFTLAHEFGHISMAWHQGTLSCAVTVSGSVTESVRTNAIQLFELEREADLFAARLLIPRRFVMALDSEDVEGLLQAVNATGVSAEAAIYGISSYLPPGYTFVLLDAFGTSVRAVSRSYGTISLPILRNQPLDEEFLRPFLRESGHHKYGGSHIFWGQHVAAMELTTASPEWRPVLTEILRALTSTPPSGQTWRRINGVASAAHSSTGHHDVKALAVRIRQSFMKHDEFAVLTEHPRFDEFASSRALAFAET